MPGRKYSSGNDYRFGFNGMENDKETETIHYKYREYDPKTIRFLSVDPLASAFAWNSPYAFAENRVIDGVEFEGLEVVLVNKNNSAGDAMIHEIGTNYEDSDPGTEHIFAHGSYQSMSGVTPKNFNRIMTQKSKKWRERKNGQKMAIVLHSCRTGRIVERKGVKKSYAMDLSKKYSDVIFVAPTERDYFSDKEKGPYIAKYADEDGNYTKKLSNGLFDKTRTNKEGIWNVYYDGKWQGTIPKQSDIKGEDLDFYKEVLQRERVTVDNAKQDNTSVDSPDIIEK